MTPSELRRGATGIVYKVTSDIVVKRPTATGLAAFLHENRIFELLEKHPRCPELVISLFRQENANFLEFMPNFTLAERLQRNQVRNAQVVLSVTKIEPLSLRESWMKALARGLAWLESLGLAHGDPRPENILIDAQDRLKIADFDCTDSIGAEFEACIPPYGRLLEDGFAGQLGARTEQFALGSLFYYINYGFEVYGNVNFGKEHGPIVVDRLQCLTFPILTADVEKDAIIDNCWHGRYTTISSLSQDISDKCNLTAYDPGTICMERFIQLQRDCHQLLVDGVLGQIKGY